MAWYTQWEVGPGAWVAGRVADSLAVGGSTHKKAPHPLSIRGSMRYFITMHRPADIFAPQRTRLAQGDEGVPGDPADEVGVATKTRAKPKKPSQFKVLLLNDDYTPMEFVVLVLKRFFSMDLEQATRVMLHVHQKGVGVCGIFPYEIAETKVTQVMDFARQNQHPLQCTLEKA